MKTNNKLLVLLLMVLPLVFSFQNKEKKAAPQATAKTEATVTKPAEEAKEIKWLTLEEVQVAMKKQPKRVYIDVYTDWCGWCKTMERNTFSNANVIKYINDNFYAVRFNAETRDSIDFMGHRYGFLADGSRGANELAYAMMDNKMSYPTSILMEANFQNINRLPGYLDVKTMETVLKYLNEEHFKTTPFDQWQKEFKPVWN